MGAARLDRYLPKLRGKRIGMVVNQTSTIGNTHLVDSLASLGIQVTRIFAPEHGFRGDADAGAKIKDGRDERTQAPIISLYGAKREPAQEDLADLDWLIFDIQDVGVRFYTYISTLHYVMQACAKFGTPLMVLDRPNPNGHYVDGPLLDPSYRSFVGMHPVPVVHGMTVGEYAQMINGQGWLDGGIKCALTVVPCANYTHQTPYEIPIPPSPNLPNNRAIYLYPSICYFEGTEISVGRGTDQQFQVLGAPEYNAGDYQFTPVPKPGAMQPPHQDKRCNGYNLSTLDPAAIWAEKRINLKYLLDIYANYPDKNQFFLKSLFFDKLAGSAQLRAMLQARRSEAEIRASWEPQLSAYKQMRKAYLLYAE